MTREMAPIAPFRFALRRCYIRLTCEIDYLKVSSDVAVKYLPMRAFATWPFHSCHRQIVMAARFSKGDYSTQIFCIGARHHPAAALSHEGSLMNTGHREDSDQTHPVRTAPANLLHIKVRCNMESDAIVRDIAWKLRNSLVHWTRQLFFQSDPA